MEDVPGPAGDDGGARVGQEKTDAKGFKVAKEEHLAKGDVLQILGVTLGIAGEITVLLNRQGGGTVQASMTRAAVQKVGPRPGDMILLEKDVRPVVSSHYNPMQLICLGSDACVRMGAIKDEEACEDAEEGRDVGGHEAGAPGGAPASCRQPEACSRQHNSFVKCSLPDRAASQGENVGGQEELETVLCQETQPVCPKPTTTVVSPGEQVASRPASTWQSRPGASINDDMYYAFTTDSDDEGDPGERGADGDEVDDLLAGLDDPF